MSTAADHYARAEALLKTIDVEGGSNDLRVQAATAHATLALVAVQADACAVAAAPSITAHGAVDHREVVRRMAFVKTTGPVKG